jgi:hypothetical protein
MGVQCEAESKTFLYLEIRRIATWGQIRNTAFRFEKSRTRAIVARLIYNRLRIFNVFVKHDQR